jgi:hypothetical protein
MARTVSRPKIKKVDNPAFYEDFQGWPFQKGDVVIAFCPYTGDNEECRVISLGQGTYDPIACSAKGKVTLKQVDCPHGGGDTEWVFDYDSDRCVLIKGHPDNKNLFMREQFEEYSAEVLAKFDAFERLEPTDS